MENEGGNLSLAKKRLLNDFKHIKEAQETDDESVLASPNDDDINDLGLYNFWPRKLSLGRGRF